MAIDKAVDSSALDASLTAVADAIREKTGKTATMTLAEMPTEIEGISGGGDTTAEDRIVDRTISGAYTNDRVTKVGDYVFYNCYSLTTVSFPNVTSISTSAFNSCSSLTTVSFPNVTSISTSAFNSCYSLTTVSFPNVTSISTSAFSFCSSLTTVSFPNVTSISTSAFRSCSKLTSADFPNATSIEDYAFNECYQLTTVNFPLVTSISMAAFQYCYSMTSADFPNATSISTSAFRNCYRLTALVLRSTSKVCSLSNVSAFNACFHILGTTSETFNPEGLKDGYIYVPDALVDSYKAATNWSTYAAQIKPLSEYTEA